MQNKIDSIFENPRTFETERLFIRPEKEEDFKFIFNLRINKLVSKFSSSNFIADEEFHRKSFRHFRTLIERKFRFHWIIVSKQTGKKIGSINVGSIYKQHSNLEIGYELQPDHWQKGIMSEALQTIINYLFQEIQLNKICAITINENFSSKKLLEKLGFSLEGILKEQTYLEHFCNYCDQARYGILRKEWQQLFSKT